MKQFRHKLILPFLLSLLCLFTVGCAVRDPLPEDETLDGIIGAEGLDNASESEDTDQIAPLTSFSLPVLEGENFNPFTAGDGIQQTVLPLLYEGLFELDETFTPQKLLCSDYSASEDFLSWRFTVRSDVQFSDGTPLSAADVAASLQAALGSARYGARFMGVTSIRAEGNAVTLQLSYPNNRLPALLDIPIVSKGTVDKDVPLGTGPYALASGDSGTPDLTPNTHAWRGIPPLSKIPLYPVDSDDSLAHLFSSHKIQMVVTDYIGPEPVSFKGALSVTEALTPTMHFLGFQTASGVFTDPALRRAVSLGVNRDGVCKAYFSGHMQPAAFPVAPTSPWYPTALDTGYSAEAFNWAMESAGYQTGHKIHVDMLVADGNSFRISAAKAMAAALSIYDLNVHVKVLPFEAYLTALQTGDFDLYYGEVRMTSDFNSSALLRTGGSLNYGRFTDPTVDARLTTAFSTGSAPAGANEALMDSIRQTAPIAVIGFKSQSVVLQGGAVDEITPTCANPFYQLSNWQIHIKGEPTNG